MKQMICRLSLCVFAVFPPAPKTEKLFEAFWILGLLNNFLWVVLNAGANEINSVAGLRLGTVGAV